MNRRKHNSSSETNPTPYEVLRDVVIPLIGNFIGAGLIITIALTIIFNIHIGDIFFDSETDTESVSDALPSGGSGSSAQASSLIRRILAENAGDVATYTQTLSNTEMIVGNANQLTINGVQYGTGCIVYQIIGPGTYSISLQYGSIKHYGNVTTNADQQGRYQEEIQNIQTYSAQDNTPGTCGVDWELIRVELP